MTKGLLHCLVQDTFDTIYIYLFEDLEWTDGFSLWGTIQSGLVILVKLLTYVYRRASHTTADDKEEARHKNLVSEIRRLFKEKEDNDERRFKMKLAVDEQRHNQKLAVDAQLHNQKLAVAAGPAQPFVQTEPCIGLLEH